MDARGFNEVPDLSELPFPQQWDRCLYRTHLTGWLGSCLSPAVRVCICGLFSLRLKEKILPRPKHVHNVFSDLFKIMSALL